MMRDIPIDIAGQEIKIRSDEDEDYVRSLASFVDEKMREVARGRNGVTTLNLALIAALTIADELHKLRESGEEIECSLDRLSARVEDSIAALDSQPTTNS
jgi:cell division protein ZapA